MSSENKKLIWIAVAVVAFVLLIVVGLVFVFAPNAKKGGASAPAAIGNTSAPKSEQPGEYLAVPAPLPADGTPAGGSAQDTLPGTGGQVSGETDSLAPDAPGSAQQAAGQNGINTQSGDIIVIYGDKPQLSDSNANNANGTAAASTQSSTAVTAKPAAAAPASTAAAKPAAKPAAAKPAAAKPQAAQTSAKPQAKPAAAKKPAAAQPSYWIQAASFSNRAKAEELKEKLATRGVSAIIITRTISGKAWYRVRIGPYATKSEADGWLTSIKTMPDCAQASIWQ